MASTTILTLAGRGIEGSHRGGREKIERKGGFSIEKRPHNFSFRTRDSQKRL
jgi:hypothetical protein